MLNKKEQIIKAINWNKIENNYVKLFWDQNIRQFWVDEEISLVEDRKHWDKLNQEQKDTYEKILAGLTLLDTEQGGVGMPLILDKIDDLHVKAVFAFMAAMEQMHAKSYSTIFSTLSNSERINELFDWVQDNKYLQYKVKKVDSYYRKINNEEDLYLALTTSVLLETFLFYSGFFYPLWFSGQGKLVGSGEIINLIIRDESVHGTFVGLIAQNIFKKFTIEKKAELSKKVYDLMLDLYQNEINYTKELYDKVNLTDDVVKFIKYNADKALMNFGFDPYFNINDKDINPIILNGLDTETKTHDFFSTKGNGYIKPIVHEELNDEDFEDF
ncbi:MAG: ribonucleoside-diphosphate reductase subunit beta [Candidatus Hepatoplasma scabrum]|nr:MAG: ribonucleoside-diphosphate reductase subunit beta [Candidatus Hepatoplasma sp.]